MNQKILDRIADITAIVGVLVTLLFLKLSWNHLPDFINVIPAFDSAWSIEKGSLLIFCVVIGIIHIQLYLLSRHPRLLIEPWLINDRNRFAQFKIARQSHFFMRMQLVFLLNGAIIGEVLVALEKIDTAYFTVFQRALMTSIVMFWGFYTYRAYRCQ